MIDEKYKNRVANLVKQAKDKGAIKSYKNFCKTKDADTYALSKDEIVYYTSASICNSRWRTSNRYKLLWIFTIFQYE